MRVKTVTRSGWTPPSLRTADRVIQQGCEKLAGKTYIRYVRWNKRRAAFVLELLVLAKSPLDLILRRQPLAGWGEKDPALKALLGKTK